jgi:hypothetical protein
VLLESITSRLGARPDFIMESGKDNTCLKMTWSEDNKATAKSRKTRRGGELVNTEGELLPKVGTTRSSSISSNCSSPLPPVRAVLAVTVRAPYTEPEHEQTAGRSGDGPRLRISLPGNIPLRRIPTPADVHTEEPKKPYRYLRSSLRYRAWIKRRFPTEIERDTPALSTRHGTTAAAKPSIPATAKTPMDRQKRKTTADDKPTTKRRQTTMMPRPVRLQQQQPARTNTEQAMITETTTPPRHPRPAQPRGTLITDTQQSPISRLHSPRPAHPDDKPITTKTTQPASQPIKLQQQSPPRTNSTKPTPTPRSTHPANKLITQAETTETTTQPINLQQQLPQTTNTERSPDKPITQHEITKTTQPIKLQQQPPPSPIQQNTTPAFSSRHEFYV